MTEFFSRELLNFVKICIFAFQSSEQKQKVCKRKHRVFVDSGIS